jgi:hypothetical protein
LISGRQRTPASETGGSLSVRESGSYVLTFAPTRISSSTKRILHPEEATVQFIRHRQDATALLNTRADQRQASWISTTWISTTAARADGEAVVTVIAFGLDKKSSANPAELPKSAPSDILLKLRA